MNVTKPVGSRVITTSEQVNEARRLLRRFLTPTRLTPADRIGRDSDTQIYLKLETELPTRSFKPRGALYALIKNQEQRSIKGVVAASTGNHGAAVAYAAGLAKLPATIFLPQSPNPIKRARIVSLGATVQEVESKGQSLANAAASFAEEHDYYFLDDASDEFVPLSSRLPRLFATIVSPVAKNATSRLMRCRSAPVMRVRRSEISVEKSTSSTVHVFLIALRYIS